MTDFDLLLDLQGSIRTPARSKLFSLAPDGAGTPDQEGLLSLLVRTCHAHAVNPRLVIRDILPAAEQKIRSIPTAAFYQHLAGTMNGLSKYAKLGQILDVRLAQLAYRHGCSYSRYADDLPEEYVFRPAKGEGVISLSKPWRQVRKEAGLPEALGLHGLRHSLASHLAMDGASSAELMESLGHKQVSTTMRYIHFAEKSKSTLAERAAATALAGLADSMGKTKADVVPMKKRKGKTAA